MFVDHLHFSFYQSSCFCLGCYIWAFCSPSTSSVPGLSRHENWSGLPFPSPGDLPTQWSNPWLLHCQVDSLSLSHFYIPKMINSFIKILLIIFSNVWLSLISWFKKCSKLYIFLCQIYYSCFLKYILMCESAFTAFKCGKFEINLYGFSSLNFFLLF